MKDKGKRLFGAVGGFFKAAWARKASRVLLLLSGALLIAAVVVANKAQTLVEAYDQAVSMEEPSEQAAKPASKTAPEPSPIVIEGYQVIGKLEIPKIEVNLPVIAFTDEKALKVSVCYYQGPMPDETAIS